MQWENVFFSIKASTQNSRVKANLSLLQEPGDASVFEMWYHRDYLRRVERQCYSLKRDSTQIDESISKHICDIEIVNAVKCSLSLSPGAALIMNEVNDEYVSLLCEHGILFDKTDFKRHLKTLISENVTFAEFVKPKRCNESDHIISKNALSAAVDKVVPQYSDEALTDLAVAAESLRNELISYKNKWHFSGNVSFEHPPMLSFFLKQLLFGKKSKCITGKRDIVMSKTVHIVSQVILQNVKTDKQVTHKPISDAGFVSRIETPISIGLSLSVHNKVHSKRLVNFLSDLNLGTSYSNVLNIEKRIESVVDRMKPTGGYYIPPFVKKGKSIFFAVDNIDFLEDTFDGQNTLHGTAMVSTVQVCRL